jgi:hypothetical protein
VRIYCVTLIDSFEGVVQGWAGSKREAKEKLAEMREDFGNPEDDNGDIEQLDFPTDKAGLLSWLNAHFTRDNG